MGLLVREEERKEYQGGVFLKSFLEIVRGGASEGDPSNYNRRDDCLKKVER